MASKGLSGSAEPDSQAQGGNSTGKGNLDFWAANQVAKEQMYLADSGSQDAVASFMKNNFGLGSGTSDSVTLPGLLNPGESPMSRHNDSSFTGYTTFADLGTQNQTQSYGVGYQYGSGERDQLRLERQALESARNLVVQGDSLQSMQQADADFYRQGQANAGNPGSYLGYTFGGIFNQAGYGFARGAQGLYRLATDTDTKILFVNSAVSAWRDPGAVIRSAANGINRFSQLSVGDQASEVLKFGLETAATFGVGKVVGMTGDVAMNGVRWGVGEFGPTLGDMTYNYMSRQGMILNAVPEGSSLGMGANSTLAREIVNTTPAGTIVESGNGSIYYGAKDALGRPTGISASITDDMIKTGTPANPGIHPPGWAGDGTKFNQARGHLLGNQLGGSGDVAENLVTLQQNWVNSPVMRGYEGQIRAAVEAGQTIQYSATPMYKGMNSIPRGVTVIGTGNNGFNLGVTILNPIGF